MAAGSTYPANVEDGSGEVRIEGFVEFADSSNQPQPASNPITSGSLPTQSISSGTAFQPSATNAQTLAIAATYDASSADATCKIELSPDNSTFTTLATVTIPHATVPASGLILLHVVPVPQAWYCKVTLTHVTVTAVKY